MDGINRAEQTQQESFGSGSASELGEAFGNSLPALTSLLCNSTIGVAVFDRNLDCRAYNGALRSMMGVAGGKHGSQQFRHIFPGRIPKLEPAFRRVWNSGISLSNLEVSAKLPDVAGPRRWMVNIYPIRDESGQIQLVAATFSEVTKGRCVELKLTRLKDKFYSEVQRDPNLLEEEFTTLSARTFEIVNRSVTLLRNSLSLRFYTSEMQLEAALVRHALFMHTTRPQDWAPLPEPHDVSVITTTAALESCEEPKLTGGNPSPRERQILRHLAEGKSNKEIGSILDISTRTVECYRARIMLKLDLHSTAALVRYAIRNNIIEA